MLTERLTLTQFLTEDRRRRPGSSEETRRVDRRCRAGLQGDLQADRSGALDRRTRGAGAANVQGEQQQKLDVVANEIFLRTTEWGGCWPAWRRRSWRRRTRSRHGIRAATVCSCSTRSTVRPTSTSTFRSGASSRSCVPRHRHRRRVEDFLQPGTEQVAGGYAIYGPSTHARTHGRHRSARVHAGPRPRRVLPDQAGHQGAGGDGRVRGQHLEPAVLGAGVQRYIEECLAGTTGPREKDFNMRWVASLVAETHRILTRGGVFLYPRDSKDPAQEGRLRLLYEANPIAFLIEQAGGRARPDVSACSRSSRRSCTSGSDSSSARARKSSGSSATTPSTGDPEEQSRRCSSGFRGLYRATA